VSNNTAATLVAGTLLATCAPPVLAELGPAFTGMTGRADDASAAFFSPAGITRLERPEVGIQTMFVYAESRFDVDEATFEGGDGDNDDRVLIIPAAYYVHPLSDRWSLGFALNVPSGIGHEYGKDWSGRYLSEEADLAFVAASSTLAYRVTERWSVGGGPFVMYTTSTTKARVNNLDPDAGDGSVRLEEDGAALGFSVSTMFEFTAGTRLGLNYRSSVDPKLEGTPSFSNLDPVLREILAAADLLGTEVDVDFKVPAIAGAGFYTEFSERWSAMADLVWINMSEFGITRVAVEQDSITVDDGDYRDMYLGTAGLKYRYRKDHAVSFGAMYGTSPISDGRRGIALPLDRAIGVGVGVERPCRNFVCHINLNYLDLGEAELAEEGGALTGSIEGEFSKNWAVMLDFQLGIRF
jgi:long-chain fatty acid transport protein